jgi:LysM repeat protein
MDTIKTAFVVALLLAVLYGVYVVLNKDQALPPPEVTEMMNDIGGDDLLAPPDIDVGGGVSVANPSDFAPAARDNTSAVKDNGDSRVVVRVQPPGDSEIPTLPDAPSAIASVRPPRAEQWTADTASDASASQPIRAPQSNRDAIDTAPPASRFSPDSQYDPQGSYSFDGSVAANATPRTDDAGSNYAANAGVNEPTGNSPATALPGTSPPDVSPRENTGADSVNATRVVPPSVADGIAKAQANIAAGKYTAALAELSATYRQQQLTESERRNLQDILDPLAAKVIYSREHLLQSAHTTRGGETLTQIAAQYQVPEQLLQNINGIKDPNVLLAGTSLKVVRGPFEADVDLIHGELTLYVQDMYAGRFPITVGEDPRPVPGGYAVADKQPGREYFSADGRTIPAGDPENPYGTVWLDLGTKRLCIHGSSSSGAPAGRGGCISLSPRDARDVFGILSVGSHIQID